MLAQRKAASDLAIREPGRHQAQDVVLAGSQLLVYQLSGSERVLLDPHGRPRIGQVKNQQTASRRGEGGDQGFLVYVPRQRRGQPPAKCTLQVYRCTRQGDNRFMSASQDLYTFIVI
jgi:hypothetical protein